MLTYQNPYQAYTDGSVFSENPLSLVIALYDGALDATRRAERALAEGDIMGRAKAINKTLAIISELMASLDHEKGGEISQNLAGLYNYMQQRLLEAHTQQAVEPIIEVANLLSSLLEGWRAAGQASAAAERAADHAIPAISPETYANGPIYGGYADDSAASRLSTAYSF